MAPRNPQPADAKKHNLDSLADKLSNTTCLDLAFAMDCTGSMGSYIASAQGAIRQIAEQIVSAEKADIRFALIAEQIVSAEKADIRFALVAYRDHPPQDSSYVTQVYDWTASVGTMKRNLDKLSAQGGGDGPEAVADAMHELRKLDWRPEATKIAIMISDAPPHGLGCGGDGFPDGCPLKLDPMIIAGELAQAGITLYTVGCEPSVTPYKPFFEAIAHVTGGQYCALASASVLSDVVVGGCCEEMALERLMVDVSAEVAAMGEEMDDEEQAKKVHELLQKRNVKAKKLQRRAQDLPETSACAKKMSAEPSLAKAREWYAKEAPTSATYSSAYDGVASYMCHEPPPGSESSGSSWFSFGGLFGGGSSEEKKKRRRKSAAPEAADMGHFAAFAAAPSPATESYNVVEDSVSLAQCARMVTKSRARNGWSKKG